MENANIAHQDIAKHIFNSKGKKIEIFNSLKMVTFLLKFKHYQPSYMFFFLQSFYNKACTTFWNQQ